MEIDLRTCKRGDRLISSQGAILEYVRPTKKGEYLDHVVKYMEKVEGESLGKGTRTHDGYVFKHNRKPEVDHDIVKIIPKNMNNFSNMTKGNQIKQFKIFLRDKRLWSEFEREYLKPLNNTANQSLATFFKYNHRDSWVVGSMSWNGTVRGHAFWSDINDKWLDFTK